MKNTTYSLFVLILILCSGQRISAQDTVKVYIDSIGVEQISEEPPVFRIPVRARNLTNVSGFQLNLSIAGEGAPVILDVEFVGDLASPSNLDVISADSLSSRSAFVSGEESVTIPDDEIIGYIIVRYDLINLPLDIIITSLIVVQLGTGQAVAPSMAINGIGLQYNPNRELTGRVQDPLGRAVPGIMVTLSRLDTIMRDTTGAGGTYLFSGVPAQGGGTLQVAGYDRILPRSERINGVNVADLAFIIRSILGIATIEDSRAQLAGDVSGDGSLDVNDLILIRSYTLGRSNELGDAPYFKFFTTEGMLEQVELEQAIADDLTIDFTVVKMGDVNFSGF